MPMVSAHFRSQHDEFAAIRRFNGFQNGGSPPSWISKCLNFLTAGSFRGPNSDNTPNVVEICQSVADISLSFDFQHSGRLRDVGLLKVRNFNGPYSLYRVSKEIISHHDVIAVVRRRLGSFIRIKQCFFCDGTSRYGVPENLTTA